MKDGDNANRLASFPDLVHQSVCSEPKGPKTPQLPAEPMTGLGIGLEQRDRVEDGLRYADVERRDLGPGGSGEEDTGHASAPTSTLSLRDVGANLVEGRHAAGLDVGETALDRANRSSVGEDLGRFLQAFVLVDGDDRGSGTPMASNDDVLAAIGDLIEEVCELGAKLFHRDGLSHT